MRYLAIVVVASSLSACSGSEFSGEAKADQASDAGADSDHRADSETPDAAPDGDDLPDVDVPFVEAGADAGCMAKSAGCACVEGKCGIGLGCAEGICVAVPAPVAHWRFEGDAWDSSGNGFHGDVAPTATSVTFADGAAAFDGTGYVDISLFTAKFEQIWGRFTLFVRFRATDYASDPILFGLGEAGELESMNGWWFMVTEGKMSIDTETGAGIDNVVIFGEVLPVVTWLDAVFVVSGNQAKYYQNGVLIGSQPFVFPQTMAGKMQIGGWVTPPESVLNGEIDDVQIFADALDLSQIKALPSLR